MGLFDFLILGITIFYLVFNILILVIRLKSTDDKAQKRIYFKIYIPLITLCTSVLVLYFAIMEFATILTNH